MFKARRTVGDEALKMDRAYLDAESGRVTCCWNAPDRQQVVDLFKRAGVVFETITQVEEISENAFK
ncbi:MAG: nickel-binding protein [bacterium]